MAKTVYSYDGPGFRPEVLKQYNYKGIQNRVYKYIPEASVVGVLLEGDANITTVAAKTLSGVLQHNPYNWMVTNDSFDRRENTTKSSDMMKASVNEWVMSLNEEQMNMFVDTIISIFSVSNAKTITQLYSVGMKAVPEILITANSVDKEQKQEVKDIIKAFFDILYENGKEASLEKIKAKKDS